MLASGRRGAKTRSGKPCISPAVGGKRRCHLHGGAAGSGAPRGNKNALKHGRFTREAYEERQLVRSLVQESRALISKIRPPASRRRSISVLFAVSFSQSDAGAAAVLVDECVAAALIVAKLLSPCVARLMESNTLTGPVLVDEFNPRSFEGPANCHFVGGGK
jgi:hypothetical protein